MSNALLDNWHESWPPWQIGRAGALRRLWLGTSDYHGEWWVDPTEVVELQPKPVRQLGYGANAAPPRLIPFTLVRLRRQPDPVLVIGSSAQVCALLEIHVSTVDP